MCSCNNIHYPDMRICALCKGYHKNWPFASWTPKYLNTLELKGDSDNQKSQGIRGRGVTNKNERRSGVNQILLQSVSLSLSLCFGIVMLDLSAWNLEPYYS